jgi:hypothetical protein
VREFESPTVEWASFVNANRASEQSWHEFEMVMGPIADDEADSAIGAYFSGAYGEVGSRRAMGVLQERIGSRELPMQVFFGTDRATGYLMEIGRDTVYG